MNILKVNIAAVIIAMSLTACGDGAKQKSEKNEKAKKTEQTKSVTKYAYNPENGEVGWTAYKFTEKTGVSGVFETIEFENLSKAKHTAKVFEGASFTIPVESINSQHEGRDSKIREYFFGLLENTDQITGKINSFHKESGTCKIRLMMNNRGADVEGSYVVTDNVFEFEADIDVTDFDASHAIDKLNEICKKLHIGEDGKSVLWPDVSIRFKADLDEVG